MKIIAVFSDISCLIGRNLLKTLKYTNLTCYGDTNENCMGI